MICSQVSYFLCSASTNKVDYKPPKFLNWPLYYISPYWLQSWEDTQSPFKKMGIWEFCFYKFRHPDYQFDHLFHGCHPLYGEEFRLIREKLLPGWLMVVQLFITISLILRLRPFVFFPAFWRTGKRQHDRNYVHRE